jgi:hypothetical protein
LKALHWYNTKCTGSNAGTDYMRDCLGTRCQHLNAALAGRVVNKGAAGWPVLCLQLRPLLFCCVLHGDVGGNTPSSSAATLALWQSWCGGVGTGSSQQHLCAEDARLPPRSAHMISMTQQVVWSVQLRERGRRQHPRHHSVMLSAAAVGNHRHDTPPPHLYDACSAAWGGQAHL